MSDINFSNEGPLATRIRSVSDSPERPDDLSGLVSGELAPIGGDISRYLNVRKAQRPSLSPDGQRVSFITQITGKSQLWVVDAAGGWPIQYTFGRPLRFHQWSPRGDWIVYGKDDAGNEREGFFLISASGDAGRELLPPSDAFRVFGGFNHDGSCVAYAGTERNGSDFDIYVLDIDSGENRLVFHGRAGMYAVSWSPDGRHLILTEERGEDANDVHLLEIATGTIETLFEPHEASYYGSFSWSPDSSGFYMATNQNRDYIGVAYYDIKAGSLSYVETSDCDFEQVALSPDGEILAWSINEEGYSKLYFRNIHSGEAIAPPEPPRGVYRIQWATHASVLAITVSGPQLPGDIWTWHVTPGQLHRSTRSAVVGFDLKRLVEPEACRFDVEDGTTVHGLLYLPPGATQGKKVPVLIEVHGGPTMQARPCFNPVHQYFLHHGIAVFDLNYRGSTGFGKHYARLNDGRLRENEILDISGAVTWLARERPVDTSRAALMGASYGGYLTMYAMTRLPDHFRAGVAFVGVSNWITALEGTSPQLRASDRIEYGDIDNLADREFFRRISPITHVANVKAPMMVVHGVNDPRNPVCESDKFVEAIRDHGGRVHYLRFQDEGHGIQKLSNRIKAYRRIAGFLERILQGGDDYMIDIDENLSSDH